eukprot:TRINITY_DN21999_c0_g1_i1.p1 TRINITY_DN21999_c0_g1~~TRINITY_DN21999_c0_g1_i1.p1  ORF type:complete len:650 (-),score=164.94 TRINITY_DN21999_c0_g1_i1:36-1985(-)
MSAQGDAGGLPAAKRRRLRRVVSDADGFKAEAKEEPERTPASSSSAPPPSAVSPVTSLGDAKKPTEMASAPTEPREASNNAEPAASEPAVKKRIIKKTIVRRVVKQPALDAEEGRPTLPPPTGNSTPGSQPKQELLQPVKNEDSSAAALPSQAKKLDKADSAPAPKQTTPKKSAARGRGVKPQPEQQPAVASEADHAETPEESPTKGAAVAESDQPVEKQQCAKVVNAARTYLRSKAKREGEKGGAEAAETEARLQALASLSRGEKVKFYSHNASRKAGTWNWDVLDERRRTMPEPGSSTAASSTSKPRPPGKRAARKDAAAEPTANGVPEADEEPTPKVEPLIKAEPVAKAEPQSAAASAQARQPPRAQTLARAKEEAAPQPPSKASGARPALGSRAALAPTPSSEESSEDADEDDAEEDQRPITPLPVWQPAAPPPSMPSLVNDGPILPNDAYMLQKMKEESELEEKLQASTPHSSASAGLQAGNGESDAASAPQVQLNDASADAFADALSIRPLTETHQPSTAARRFAPVQTAGMAQRNARMRRPPGASAAAARLSASSTHAAGTRPPPPRAAMKKGCPHIRREKMADAGHMWICTDCGEELYFDGWKMEYSTAGRWISTQKNPDIGLSMEVARMASGLWSPGASW